MTEDDVMDEIEGRRRRHGDTRLGRAVEEARRWVMVVLIVLVAALGWQGSRLGHQVSSLGHQVSSLNDSVSRVEQSSSRTEVAADELVRFVHEVQSQPATSQTQAAVQQLIAILCASSDPARVQACAALNKPGG